MNTKQLKNTVLFPIGNKKLIFIKKSDIISCMKIENTKDFGDFIRGTRKGINMTQGQLAAVSGVGVRFISELENGKKTVQLDKALRVAYVLGIKIEMGQ